MAGPEHTLWFLAQWGQIGPFGNTLALGSGGTAVPGDCHASRASALQVPEVGSSLDGELKVGYSLSPQHGHRKEGVGWGFEVRPGLRWYKVG